MDEMKELIDERVVEQVIGAVALLGPVLGLVGGFVSSRKHGRPVSWGLTRGLGVGLLGTLVWVLWRLFSWLVRYQPAADPKHDYFGLERVDVLFLNIVIFVAVGAAVGYVIRRVREGDAAALPEPAAEPVSEADAAG